MRHRLCAEYYMESHATGHFIVMTFSLSPFLGSTSKSYRHPVCSVVSVCDVNSVLRLCHLADLCFQFYLCSTLSHILT